MHEGISFQVEWDYFDPHTGNGESLKVRVEQWYYVKSGAHVTITDEIVTELDHGFEAGWYT
jgi:hypothetical protein